MRQACNRSLLLTSPDETARLAAAFASHLADGETLLLDGPIGSGKTHFCRALIQARMEQAGAPVEDIPSPTFTLVQTYEVGDTEIWHADLYRLTHPDEIEELGLMDAFLDQICLVEWPDRLGDLTPKDALTLSFSTTPNEDERHVQTTASSGHWTEKLESILAEISHD